MSRHCEAWLPTCFLILVGGGLHISLIMSVFSSSLTSFLFSIGEATLSSNTVILPSLVLLISSSKVQGTMLCMRSNPGLLHACKDMLQSSYFGFWAAPNAFRAYSWLSAPGSFHRPQNKTEKP